ncbi:MAG: hypothetical protein N2169_00735 [bacterium]|nr:hypothetical protein [bacterium]
MIRSSIIFIILIFSFCFAGIELVKKEKNKIVHYFLKFNNTEYRLIYLPKSMDNPNIMRVLKKNIFSDLPVKYKIAFNEYNGNYGVYINNDLLFTFDKYCAYSLGYSDINSLLQSYHNNLSNLKYVPDVFFESTYIEALVNQTKSIRIFNKSNRSFTLNIPEYCYYQDGKLYIKHSKPILQQTITVSYDNITDSSYITIKIPTIEVRDYQYSIYYRNPIIFEKVNLFKSFILPNLVQNGDYEIKYSEMRTSKGRRYRIWTPEAFFPYKSVQREVEIALKNDKTVPNMGFDYLIMSNNPEKIQKKGIIYETDILEKSGYWIWFHHQFMSNLNYCIEIENLEEYGQDVVEIEFFGSFNKSDSEVETGIRTSIDFYEFFKNKAIAKTKVYPNQKVRLIFEKVFVNQVITGFLYLNSNKKLKLRIFTFDGAFPSEYLPEDGTPRSTGKFPKPIIHKEYHFETAKNFDSFRLPDKEIISNQEKQNYSNYGVLYKLIFKITNNKEYFQKVSIYFSSISGYTPLIFMNNLDIYRVSSGSYKKILEVSLKPYETVDYPISFVITPGLSYPIEFEISTSNL